MTFCSASVSEGGRFLTQEDFVQRRVEANRHQQNDLEREALITFQNFSHSGGVRDVRRKLPTCTGIRSPVCCEKLFKRGPHTVVNTIDLFDDSWVGLLCAEIIVAPAVAR